jgi:hypothetical protein
LIRACVDDEHTLRHEASIVGDALAVTLGRLAAERAAFVTALERIQERESSHDGSWREMSREAAREVWLAAAGANDGDAMAACRHSSARTAAVYEEALLLPWPDATLSVLMAQYKALREDRAWLDKLEA